MFEKPQKGSPRRPDFSSNQGVAIWKNTDKNGKEYLSVNIPLLNISVNCFEGQLTSEVDLKPEVTEEVVK